MFLRKGFQTFAHECVGVRWFCELLGLTRERELDQAGLGDIRGLRFEQAIKPLSELADLPEELEEFLFDKTSPHFFVGHSPTPMG